MIASRAAVGAIERVIESGPADLRMFRSKVLDAVRRSIPFDWYVWVLTDPVTTVGVDPLATVPDLRELPELVRLKYLTSVNRWTALDSVRALGADRRHSLLWNEVQRRHGVADVISAVLRDERGCWGFLDLWTSEVASGDAVDLLRELLPPLTHAIRSREAATFASAPDPKTVPTGSAVVLLDDELHIHGQTPSTSAWLAGLLPSQRDADPVPAAALNVAAQLLAQEAGVDDHPAVARAHLTHGVWATLKAARLKPSNQIAVTIEPSTPGERLDLFARTHGLSARERELVTILAEGADTREMSSRMFLSEHTVQDHLKSIFAKTGTHSRRSLISHALGVRTAPSDERP